MDTSTLAWFSDTLSSMEEPFLYDECDIMDFLDDGTFAAEQLEIFQSCISPNTNNTNNSSTLNIQTSISTNTLAATTISTDSPPVTTQRPPKQRKTNNHESSKASKKAKNQKVSSSPIILTFGNPTVSEMNPQQVVLGSLNTEDDAASSEVFNSRGPLGTTTNNNNGQDAAVRSPTTPRKSGGGRSRPASQTYDHIIAERKRREQLSQRFLALSRLVPGLKKMDKSSVLGETIKYLKQLQDRVKTLEEQSVKQRVESFVLVKKSSRPLDEDDQEGSSSDEMGCNNDDDDQELLSLPQIEAKLCDKHVLLRVHCEKDKKALINVLTAVENLNLSITSTSFIPFGSLAIDITITAEMPKEFNLTMKELVKSLRSALRHPMEAN